MVFGNTKWVIYNFQPHEYKSLELYLEKMLQDGWELVSWSGIFFKFKKVEKSYKKYAVDIMGKFSLVDGIDNDEAREYMDYCKSAGWEYICKNHNIQIYSNELEEATPIQTDDEALFKKVSKSGFMLVVMFILALMNCIVQFGIYFDTTGRGFAENVRLLNYVLLSTWLIESFIGMSLYIAWFIRAKKALHRNEEVIYSGVNYTKIRILLSSMIFIVASLNLFLLLSGGETNILISIVILSLIIFLICKIINYIRKSKIKRIIKKVLLFAIVPVIYILIFNIVIFNMLGGTGSNEDSEVENLPIVASDFEVFKDAKNDSGELSDFLYLDSSESFLAEHNYYSYSETEESSSFSYNLLKSEYKWIIDYTFDKFKKESKEFGIKLKKLKIDSLDNINIYKQGNQKYILYSDNTYMIAKKYVEEISEVEFLNTIYEKIFK